MVDEVRDSRRQVLLSRIYFLAVIPFGGAVLVPWIFGPGATDPTFLFVVWSYTVSLFTTATSVGFALGRDEESTHLHALVAVLTAAFGIASVLLIVAKGAAFAAVAVLMVVHWMAWLWMQKSRPINSETSRQHNRFVWTLLSCHMLVLLNLVYATRVNA